MEGDLSKLIMKTTYLTESLARIIREGADSMRARRNRRRMPR